MYNDFYGFFEDPFNVTSDPDFFFPSQHHEEAFSHLVYGIQHRKGILVITGEIGTGKTTLCRTLLSRLQNNVKTALVLNPYFSDMQLLQFIVKDLGMPGNFRSKLSLITALNNFLIEQSTSGNNVVLIIDEAQNLKVNQLEQIRLLSNLETEKEKLLQIVLVGQPELHEKLRMPELRQLNQRVTVRYHMLPLDRSDIGRYIHHRLRIASRVHEEGILGKNQLPVHFTEDAISAIFVHSKGTPRLINIICDRALLLGYVNAVNVIDEKIIVKSAREVGTFHEHHPRSAEKSSIESFAE